MELLAKMALALLSLLALLVAADHPHQNDLLALLVAALVAAELCPFRIPFASLASAA